MQALIAFWSHALCAAAFLGLLIWRLGAIRQQDQRLLLAGFAVTACWAWLTCELSCADALDCDETLLSDGWVEVDDDGLAAAMAPALENANAAMTRLRSFMWIPFH